MDLKAVTARNIQAGLQDPRDLEGLTFIPASRALCYELAREHAAVIDTQKPRRRKDTNDNGNDH